MIVFCKTKCQVLPKPCVAFILFVIAAGVRDESRISSLEDMSTQADGPKSMKAMDLFNIHDLLIVGYYAPMTRGPHLRKRTLEPPYSEVLEEAAMPAWPEDEDAYDGLKEARKGAIMLATIIHDLHPVKQCRTHFSENMEKRNRNEISDEELVELQAATAWACVGVLETDVVPCGWDGTLCEQTTQKPLTKLRYQMGNKTGKLIEWEDMEEYRNFELKNGKDLGACYQPFGTGGPKQLQIETFKDRINFGTDTQRKTAWLRACSYWSAFHALALRADALGGKLPNQLFGSIIRIVAGGALFCGG